jgi:hypothetical protein
VDLSLDPELTLALRMCLEENARHQAEVQPGTTEVRDKHDKDHIVSDI